MGDRVSLKMVDLFKPYSTGDIAVASDEEASRVGGRLASPPDIKDFAGIQHDLERLKGTLPE